MIITVFTYGYLVKCPFGIVYYIDICQYLLIMKCVLVIIFILPTVLHYITAVLRSDAEYVKWSGNIECV
jgi:hypothetical protein